MEGLQVFAAGPSQPNPSPSEAEQTDILWLTGDDLGPVLTPTWADLGADLGPTG